MTLNDRQSWRGVQQVLQYNWPTYAGTALGCAAGSVAAVASPLPPVLKRLAGIGIGAAAFWSASSLLVSHYVYDRSELGRWDWLVELVNAEPPGRLLNLHVGVDEAGGALKRLFPGAEHYTGDIYDPGVTSSASIRRARRLTAPEGSQVHSVNLSALPFEDGAWDAVFLVFAAHEVRDTAARGRLFQEIGRVLRPGGRIVVVEHLRDLPNFLAFGPGFLHFLPRRAWLSAAREARLKMAQERRVTPFVRAFVMEKPAA
jgi:SAM-dependent methyltransferase